MLKITWIGGHEGERRSNRYRSAIGLLFDYVVYDLNILFQSTLGVDHENIIIPPPSFPKQILF